MARPDQCHNIADLRAEAKRRLPKWIFEFVDRGTEDEVGIRHLRAAFDRLKLIPRALTDMTARDLGTTFLGTRLPLPAAIAPTGAAGLCWHEGELELARAAAKAGIPFTMALSSTTRLEDVAHKAGGILWFQIYIWENRSQTDALIERALAHGYSTLIVTVDVNLGVNREFNLKNGYGNPFRPGYRTVRDILLRPRWLGGVLLPYLRQGGIPKQANIPPVGKQHGNVLRGSNSDGTWDDIARLRDRWPGKLFVKGIQHPADAARAVALGADGVVVSSHGGRNLDSAPASIDALPGVRAAVGNKAAVILDSGIRRGSDMVKAYALGADLVLFGKATLYGVAAGGEAGAARAISLLRREYELTLGHIGARSIGEIGADRVAVDRPLMGMDWPPV
jgi:isopentenyl diphosphate isomerase/L-lactate dehydrogenase-like FMN-dependent dehydrogenase